MPDLKYGLSSFERMEGNLPQLPVINMFVEKAEPEMNPILQSRLGLMNSGTTLGAGPVTALYQVDGVLSGQLFAVSAGSLYSGTTNLGAMNGSGPSRIRGFSNRVFATSGTDIWEWDGTTYKKTTLPSAFSVLSIEMAADRLLLIDGGTGKYFWTDVLSDNIQTLSFASAEQSPDNLKDMLFVGDTLMLFGTETIEFWPTSSANPNLPFVPLVGRTLSSGIRATGCCTKFTNSFAWITDQNRVCVGTATNYISDPSLEEKLANSVTASLFRFYLEGVEFLAIRLDTETFVYSSHSSQWSTFTSTGYSNWIPQCYGGGKFGSAIDGRLIQWSTTYDDFGGLLERRFRAGIPITTKTVPLYNATLRTNPGQTAYTAGLYANPQIELRYSRDGGSTWSIGLSVNLGAKGSYRSQPVWKSLGYFGYPALLLDFRVVHPVPFRVSGVVINESYDDIDNSGVLNELWFSTNINSQFIPLIS